MFVPEFQTMERSHAMITRWWARQPKCQEAAKVSNLDYISSQKVRYWFRGTPFKTIKLANLPTRKGRLPKKKREVHKKKYLRKTTIIQQLIKQEDSDSEACFLETVCDPALKLEL